MWGRVFRPGRNPADGGAMNFDHTIGLLASIALLAYLVLAMLKPEKF